MSKQKEKPCYEMDKPCQNVHACWDGPCLHPIKVKRGDDLPAKGYHKLSDLKSLLSISEHQITRYAADYGIEVLDRRRITADDAERLRLIVEQERRTKTELIRQVLQSTYPQTFKHLKTH